MKIVLIIAAIALASAYAGNIYYSIPCKGGNPNCNAWYWDRSNKGDYVWRSFMTESGFQKWVAEEKLVVFAINEFDAQATRAIIEGKSKLVLPEEAK